MKLEIRKDVKSDVLERIDRLVNNMKSNKLGDSKDFLDFYADAQLIIIELNRLIDTKIDGRQALFSDFFERLWRDGIVREVKQFSNSAHVTLSKQFVGRKVLIIPL